MLILITLYKKRISIVMGVTNKQIKLYSKLGYDTCHDKGQYIDGKLVNDLEKED